MRQAAKEARRVLREQCLEAWKAEQALRQAERENRRLIRAQERAEQHEALLRLRERMRKERQKAKTQAALVVLAEKEERIKSEYKQGLVVNCKKCNDVKPAKLVSMGEMEDFGSRLLRMHATNTFACVDCGTEERVVEYEFLYSLSALNSKHRTRHEMELRLSIEPRRKWDERRQLWYPGVRLTVYGDCRCGHTLSIPIDRWKIAEKE